jgi:hypothetical protein
MAGVRTDRARVILGVFKGLIGKVKRQIKRSAFFPAPLAEGCGGLAHPFSSWLK